MDDVIAVIEQATDAAMGTPPEAPAEAPKPEMKKVRQAAKKVARKVGPKKKVGKKAKKVSQEIPKESAEEGESQEKDGKESEALRSNENLSVSWKASPHLGEGDLLRPLGHGIWARPTSRLWNFHRPTALSHSCWRRRKWQMSSLRPDRRANRQEARSPITSWRTVPIMF